MDYTEYKNKMEFTQRANEIKEAKELLKNKGYYVDTLWHIDDVKSKYDCSDDVAQEVLGHAMNTECTMNQIWEAIEYMAEDEFNLKFK